MFKVTVTNSDKEVIPGAYIRIYPPGDTKAIDSMFTDDQGKIERELPFTFESNPASVPLNYGSGYIVQKIFPNVIGHENYPLRLEYNYPGNSELFLMDIRGIIYRNHSRLSNGIYFYFIRFDDGNQSELNKIILTEDARVSIQLVNVMPGQKSGKKSQSFLEGYEAFYAEILKDGFVTIRDTLAIDSVIVEGTYRMENAALPSASFNFTGNLVAGGPVVFDASASSGANSEELSYHWSFGDGKYGGTAALTHLFTMPGEHPVTLTVSGNFGAKHSITKNLTIQPGEVSYVFTGTINGYITDENLDELDNVMVSLVEEEKTGYSHTDGIVSLSSLPVGVPLHLKITKEGYVSQVVELTIPGDTRESVFFTTLKRRAPAFTLYNAEFGGELEGEDGTILRLPIRPFVKPDGTEVTGNVNVSITPVDVAFESESFPGSFFGYNETGEDGILLSYGVSEFHFEQDGEVLLLANGKKATVLIPIYTSGTLAGEQIPLWSVNEDNGKWVQEGTGTVVESGNSPTGLALKAEVNHFSWFNCDDFEDNRKKTGLCWRWECTTAQCVKVKVGCWMSGAQRGNTSGKKSVEERDTIPPVFEVRDYVPAEGKILLMPYSRDVYIEARGFTDEGQLLGGSFTLLAADERDSLEIELAPVIASDTIDLTINTLYEEYLQPGEFLPFRVIIPEKSEYQIILNRGKEDPLNGTFIVKDYTGILLTGNTNQNDNLITAYPGELMINIAGVNQSDEGNFILGIADPTAWLPGDTVDIEPEIVYEDYLEQTAFKHHKTVVSGKTLHSILVSSGSSPNLIGRYRVWNNGRQLHAGPIDNKPLFMFAEPGELVISIAGKILTNEGNFRIELQEEDAIPIALNDSIYDSLTVDNPYRMYRLEPGHNTVLKSRFYTTEEESGYRYVKILSATGQTIQTEDMNQQERFLLTTLLKDSTYLIQVGGAADARFVLITQEDETYDIAFGDTVTRHLRYMKDKDLFHFSGKPGDLVSIRCTRPDYELAKGSFALLTPEGLLLGRRRIEDNPNIYDFEIIYKLTSDEVYSIMVESTQNDTGSYRLILDTVGYSVFDVNSQKELDVTAGRDNYFEIEIDEDKFCHFSAISPTASGSMDLWSADCEKLNEMNTYRHYSSFYNASYTNRLKAGRYYMRLMNTSGGTAYVNFAEPEPLSLDHRGEVSFPDTIHGPWQVKAYCFKALIGDGVHAELKTTDKLHIPSKLELKHYQSRTDGSPLNVKSLGLNNYSLDSTILYETGARLTGIREDNIWILIVYAETGGLYEFNFHHVASARDITVDDDYANYPGAHTSSAVAAAYAVQEGGTLLIGNGVYPSYLPLNISENYVEIRGQDKENAWLRNVYNRSDNPVIYYYGNGGTIRDLSLSCGTSNYYALEISGSDITLENLVVKPLPGKITVSGGIKGSGDNWYVNELFLDRSMWGIKLNSSGGIVENCELITDNPAIELTGENIIVRNNNITVKKGQIAINAKSVYQGTGTQLVEDNRITLLSTSSTTYTGIINMERYGGPENDKISYIRNNIIVSANPCTALSAEIGNPPAKIVLEGNRYSCTNSLGGRAFNLTALRSDGSSDIIVRNNIFEGLISWDVIGIYSTDLIMDGHRFAVYNNNFRIAGTAEQKITNNFMRISTFYSNVTDTLDLYFVNNIFQGNGFSYLAKCTYDFSFYSDYNIVYDFSSYMEGVGNIIGLTNDIDADPIFTDTELHLDPSSPAINKGATPLQFEFIPEVDIDGVTRPQGTGYDIGAYEKEE